MRGAIREAFAQWDGNKDGVIDAAEVGNVLKSINPSQADVPAEEVEAFLRSLGNPVDGKVTLEAFEAIYLHKLHARHAKPSADPGMEQYRQKRTSMHPDADQGDAGDKLVSLSDSAGKGN